jgi:hypothetical protein
MAGNARPLEVLIGEQYDYLYKLNPSSELLEAANKIKADCFSKFKRI